MWGRRGKSSSTSEGGPSWTSSASSSGSSWAPSPTSSRRCFSVRRSPYCWPSLCSSSSSSAAAFTIGASKTCRRCGAPKPATDFRPDARYKDGYASWCRSCHSEYAKEWARKNADKARASADAWRAKNPERVKAIAKRSRERHRDERFVADRLWREANREYLSTYIKAWKAANRDRMRALNVEAKRRRRWGRDGQSVRYVENVLLMDPCAYCGGPSGTVDHIVPVAGGGANGWENLTAACQPCNSRKSDMPLLIF